MVVLMPIRSYNWKAAPMHVNDSVQKNSAGFVFMYAENQLSLLKTFTHIFR